MKLTTPPPPRHSDAPLTAGQHAWLEAELQARERAIQAELHALADQAGAASDERAAVAHQLLSDDPEAVRHHPDARAVSLSRADALRAEQVALGEAWLALRDGRYGLCQACGDTIPFDRLQAQPMALRCVACQSAAEQR